MTLQERMIQYRAKHNLSQGALAKAVGVTLQTIYSIENGLQSPSKLTAAKLEMVLGKDEFDAN